ncbi:thrombomodulin [Sarcophilus harrisii]|uniref:Thrombomodulin n=1 Tax=Sarcophilus harrisii TaxID=9305 RepID=A0A7N4P5B3_SARHA|nr:thrombomodulin [Sarcophilus harrisii]
MLSLLLPLLSILTLAEPGLPTSSVPQPGGSQCIEDDCYAIFWNPEQFAGANKFCQQLGGHLMTVRSSVAADVISLLAFGTPEISSPDGRLWIGLQLGVNCSHEQEGQLRGFKWVTGDNSTSYSKWKHSGRGALCGNQCVAVSGDPASGSMELVWEEHSCNLVTEGFLCEYNYPGSCKPLNLEPSIGASVSYSTPFGGKGADFQALPLNSHASVMPLGLDLVCRKVEETPRWVKESLGAWDCGVEKGGCSQICRQDGGAPECLCSQGTLSKADLRSCQVEGASCTHSRCQQYCLLSSDAPSGYICMCDSGYELGEDGHSCVDVDDCAQETNPCPQKCVNKPGAFECECNPGFEMLDGECVKQISPCFGIKCEHKCLPLEGGTYRCTCEEGFVPVPDQPDRCMLFCNTTACRAKCNPYNVDDCKCPEGYILDENQMCSDIDECEAGECPGNECINLPGSFRCVCGPKYTPSETEQQCISIEINPVDGGSGEPPSTETPDTTTSPPPQGQVHSVVLIGIAISILSIITVLLATVCHLRKKQCAARAALDYKCAGPGKEEVLQQVRTDSVPQKL